MVTCHDAECQLDGVGVGDDETFGFTVGLTGLTEVTCHLRCVATITIHYAFALEDMQRTLPCACDTEEIAGHIQGYADTPDHEFDSPRIAVECLDCEAMSSTDREALVAPRGQEYLHYEIPSACPTR